MSKNSDEAKDFNILKKLGFKFESSDSVFSSQADSGGTKGGRTGKDEDGITGDTATEDLDENDISMLTVDENNEILDVTSLTEAETYGKTQDSGGVSEWTSQHGEHEEEVVERRESLSDRQLKLVKRK